MFAFIRRAFFCLTRKSLNYIWVVLKSLQLEFVWGLFDKFFEDLLLHYQYAGMSKFFNLLSPFANIHARNIAKFFLL